MRWILRCAQNDRQHTNDENGLAGQRHFRPKCLVLPHKVAGTLRRAVRFRKLLAFDGCGTAERAYYFESGAVQLVRSVWSNAQASASHAGHGVHLVQLGT